MRIYSTIISTALLSCGIFPWSGAQAAWAADKVHPYRVSEAYQQAKQQGWKLVRIEKARISQLSADEWVVVEHKGSKWRTRVLLATGDESVEGGFRTTIASTPATASRLRRLSLQRLLPGAPKAVLAVFENADPDELQLSVRILGKASTGPPEMLKTTVFVPQKRGAGLLDLGNAKPRLEVRPPQGEAPAELVWVTGPQVLTVPGREKKPVRIAIGAYEEVYQYQAAKGWYQKSPETRVQDFLPMRSIKKLKVNRQVNPVFEPPKPEWVADGNLETAWRLKLKEAKGARLKVHLKDRPKVAMIRVVPGCAANAEEWKTHGQIQAFSWLLGTGRRIRIDREHLDQVPRGVAAIGEFPLEEGYGAQLLVFLESPEPLPWARIDVDRARRGAAARGQRVPEACISEVSFH